MGSFFWDEGQGLEPVAGHSCPETPAIIPFRNTQWEGEPVPVHHVGPNLMAVELPGGEHHGSSDNKIRQSTTGEWNKVSWLFFTGWSVKGG